ncbi:MAG: peptidoglycan DD-metalloendopeptidase family protein [Elusimicrobia bacterium]|nr:peptidoglycan DD-metalloendopeptidase family protein [Elusimicrobiota bacterium]
MLYQNKKGLLDSKLAGWLVFCLSLSIYLSIYPAICVYAADYDKQIKEYKKKIKQSKKELIGVKTEISKKENSIKDIKKTEATLESRLKKILRNLEAAKTALQKIKNSIKKQQQSINSLRIKLARAKSETKRWKSILRREIRFAYKQGVGRPVSDPYLARIILSSNSSADLIKRYKFLQLLARQKSFVYIQTLKNVNEYESLKTKLEKGMESLKKLESEKKKTEQSYLKEENKNKKLLSGVTKKRVFYEQEVANLKDSETMLSELITLLNKKAKETEKKKEEERLARLKISKKKGILSWPLEGEPDQLRKKVTSKFGKQKHHQLNTWVINNGIRIKSNLGENIIAIDKGTVVFSGDFKSYGNVVIIDHSGGFYTVYGNMDKILVKEDHEVKKGDVLGTVGISVYTQDASLYFEFRRDGAPTNPLVWLK